MANPFDETLKHLVEAQPSAWLEYIGVAGDPIEVIDADISTMTTAADKVIKVGGPHPFLVHLEFQSGDPTGLGERTLFQDVALRNRHALPVYSAIILLRKKADSPKVTGVVRYTNPVQGGLTLDFKYHVIRVWEIPVEEALSGPLATLPLAPLANVSRAALPEAIAKMKVRIEQEVTRGEARELWSATLILMGLKYPNAFTEEMLKGIQDMEESTTYQAIIRRGKAEGKIEGKVEGRLEEAKTILERLGNVRFGTPSADMAATLAGITSVERLEQLAERLLKVESWDDLLAQ